MSEDKSGDKPEDKKEDSPAAKKIDTNLTPLAIIVGAIIIAASNLATNGTLKNKVTGTQTTAPATTTASSAPQANPENVDRLKADDHIRGDPKAQILFIEYSDLECPFCKRFHPTAQQVVDTYGGKVAWVYRHFPLVQIHSKAPKEAEAVECAGEQAGNDGFWKLTDKIFEVTPSNNGLNLDDLPKLASQVGLDGGKLKACMDSNKYSQKVQEQLQSGIKIGIGGTPGTVVLDTKTGKAKLIPGALPFENVKSEIDALLSGS